MYTNSEYLKAVDERAGRATPGPWESAPKWLPGNSGPDEYAVSVGETAQCLTYSPFGLGDCPPQVEKDSDFCAHARTDVEVLSARVKELEAVLERLLDYVDQLCEDVGISKHYYSTELARGALATPPPEK